MTEDELEPVFQAIDRSTALLEYVRKLQEIVQAVAKKDYIITDYHGNYNCLWCGTDPGEVHRDRCTWRKAYLLEFDKERNGEELK